MLIATEGVCAYAVQGKRYDAGNKADYVQAIVDFALERDDLRDEILEYLRMTWANA